MMLNINKNNLKKGVRYVFVNSLVGRACKNRYVNPNTYVMVATVVNRNECVDDESALYKLSLVNHYKLRYKVNLDLLHGENENRDTYYEKLSNQYCILIFCLFRKWINNELVYKNSILLPSQDISNVYIIVFSHLPAELNQIINEYA